MVKNLLFISLIILIIYCSFTNKNETYYTFFTPYYNENVQRTIDLKSYDQKIYNITTYQEISELISKLLTLIIQNTTVLNFKKYLVSNITKNLELLNTNKINFSIVPLPLLDDVYKYNNVRLMINLNKSTLYFLYNNNVYKNNITINDIKKKETIGIYIPKKNKDLITVQIVKDLFTDYKFKYKLITNINVILNDKINCMIFISSNPSKLLQNILNLDTTNKLNILNLDINDLKIYKYQISYFNQYVKFKHPNLQYSNYTIQTISFLNTLITNKFTSEKVVYELIDYIYVNINLLNLEIEDFDPIGILYKNLLPSSVNIILHIGASKYYKNKGLTSLGKECLFNIGNNDCSDNNFN